MVWKIKNKTKWVDAGWELRSKDQNIKDLRRYLNELKDGYEHKTQ
jgi:hypothetical protein